jgi:AcrR family transcriptional regulator
MILPCSGAVNSPGGATVPRQRADASNRSAILAAAREELAAHGYHGMTMRRVAGRAGVDPRLVRYYFPSKQELVHSCIDARLDAETVRAELAGDEDSIGHRLVRRVLRTWDEQPVSCRALLAAAVSEQEAGAVMALVVSAVEPVVQSYAPDRQPLRSALICAQLVGLWMTVGVAGVVDLRRSTEQLARLAGDAVQRLIKAPLPPI